MDLTSDETDDHTRTEAPSGELQLQNLLDQLQTMQLQVPFASTRYRFSNSWSKTKNYFHPQRSLIADVCEYVGEKIDSETSFRLELFLFARILRKKVSPQQKEESILKISEEWSRLRPMIKENITSDTLDERTKEKMYEILVDMGEYKKYYSDIFNRSAVATKTDIKDNHKKSKSTKTQTKRTRDEISRRKLYDKLLRYSPERNRRKDHRKKEKRHTKRYSDSDSTDSSPESSENESDSSEDEELEKYRRKGGRGRKKDPRSDKDWRSPSMPKRFSLRY